MQETDVFYPASLTAWRKWFEENHLSKQAVWLVFHSKSSGRPSISWTEAVDVALCFGWIDSKKIKIDAETSHQFFSRRKVQSTWSKINKEKVKSLIAQGLMTAAGLEAIAVAKENGSWTILDEVEALIVPEDLTVALAAVEGAEDYFLSLSKSMRKMLLQWLVLAKRHETRQKRIAEIATYAGLQQRPPQFQL